MKAQMIRVISSPSSSTIGFSTGILLTEAAMLPMGWHNQVDGHSRAPHRRYTPGLQPAPSAGGLQPFRRRPPAERGAAARGCRLGRGPGPRAGRDLWLTPDDPL